MAKIDALIEQTAFLLEKQKEANTDCAAIFAGLLVAVDEKIAQTRGGVDDATSLTKIRDLIAAQSAKVAEEAQLDIDFLQDQLQALKNIKDVKDAAKARELMGMLIDENEEIKDTETFKKDVAEESAISKQNLMTMVNDIKDAIKEGNAQDVAMYLESILDVSEDEDGCEDDCEDDDCCGDFFEDEEEEDGCCDEPKVCTCGRGEGGLCTCKKNDAKQSGGCGGCNGCGSGKGGCGTGKGCGSVDLFGDLEKYEKALLQEADEKIKH